VPARACDIYHIHSKEIEMSSSTGPSGFPAGIAVSQETFENWALMITVPDAWTCVPKTADDVVQVCNWAAGAGYTVRPRGIMHGWSPLSVTDGESTAKLMLVDTTQALNQVVSITAANGGQPAQVKVQAGATMNALMAALENANASGGYSFAHIPAPGNITVGGALAINAHGTAVPGCNPIDDFDVPYGSLSNQILAFTAVAVEPGTDAYVAKMFTRDEADAKAFLTHCGRAFLLDVTLQVTENYNLQCRSMMDISSKTLFAQPGAGGTPPAQSVGDFLNQSGRVEVIWFPSFPILGIQPPSYPWLKVWTVQPDQPAGSRLVTEPYNYPFSDNLPLAVTQILKDIVNGAAWLTPIFTSTFATITSAGLNGDLGGQNSTDLWGKSKNTLLYVKDTTLRVTANGYAVLMKKDQVQAAVADFATQFTSMLAAYQKNNLWPINSPLEIRVTALDDPAKIVPASGAPTRTVISSLSIDPVVEQNGWDVACWFDVLTVIPTGDPQKAFQFYTELESWFASHFGSGYRVCPEWSKGWAYTSDQGPWTNAAGLQTIRDTFTTGRSADDNWAWEVATLKKYDPFNLFSNPFLDTLFT
jgi:hypothetical protein